MQAVEKRPFIVLTEDNFEEVLEIIKLSLEGLNSIYDRSIYAQDFLQAEKLLELHCKKMSCVKDEASEKTLLGQLSEQLFTKETINIESPWHTPGRRIIGIRDNHGEGLYIEPGAKLYFSENGIFVEEKEKSFNHGETFFSAWIYPRQLIKMFGQTTDGVRAVGDLYLHLLKNQQTKMILEMMGP